MRKNLFRWNIGQHIFPSDNCRYYERLADVQARGSQTTHNVLRDILREVQSSMVPKTLLKDWAARNFRSATDYWQFRKMVRFIEFKIHAV